MTTPEFIFAHGIKEQVLLVTSRLVIRCEQGGQSYLGLDISVYEILLS